MVININIYYTSTVCDVCQALAVIKKKKEKIMLDTPLVGMLGGTKM
jgi:hypothetical protein